MLELTSRQKIPPNRTMVTTKLPEITGYKMDSLYPIHLKFSEKEYRKILPDISVSVHHIHKVASEMGVSVDQIMFYIKHRNTLFTL